MLQNILKSIFFIFSVFFIFWLQFLSLILTNNSIFQINFPVLGIILIIFWYESGWVVWFAFLVYFFFELFAVTPFGLLLFSGTVSALIVYYLFQTIFTNRSWYSIFLLTLLAVLNFRVIYFVLYSLAGFVHFSDLNAQTAYLWHTIGEASLTALIMLILFFILSKFFKK